jgi:alpha-mannosidase
MFFTLEKISRQLPEIRKAIYREAIDIPTFKYIEAACPGAEQVDFDDRAWADFQVGSTWGGYDINAWFRACLTIPQHWMERKVVLQR